jgi:hypothetical protein
MHRNAHEGGDQVRLVRLMYQMAIEPAPDGSNGHHMHTPSARRAEG